MHIFLHLIPNNKKKRLIPKEKIYYRQKQELKIPNQIKAYIFLIHILFINYI